MSAECQHCAQQGTAPAPHCSHSQPGPPGAQGQGHPARQQGVGWLKSWHSRWRAFNTAGAWGRCVLGGGIGAQSPALGLGGTGPGTKGLKRDVLGLEEDLSSAVSAGERGWGGRTQGGCGLRFSALCTAPSTLGPSHPAKGGKAPSGWPREWHELGVSHSACCPSWARRLQMAMLPSLYAWSVHSRAGPACVQSWGRTRFKGKGSASEAIISKQWVTHRS